MNKEGIFTMKQNAAQVYVGIDVAKDWCDLAVEGGKRVEHFPTDSPAGRSRLVAKLRAARPALVCLEASGGYEIPLVRDLQDAGVPVAVVNPKRIRDFAKAAGLLAKTDQLDARAIARFAALMEPRRSEKPSENQEKLRALRTRRNQVVEALTRERNRLGTERDADVRRHIQNAVELCERQLRELDEQLEQCVRDDEELRQKVRRLASTPGVGIVTAIGLLVETPELGTLNRREAGRLAGLAPINRDSGKHRGKRMIGGGRPAVRRALYMATLVAARHNPRIRDHYQQLLARGKKKLAALTACMRKLLLILNAMLKNNQSWNSNPQTS
jgi:transposase